jgi:DNA-binding NtrC family response regulator
LSEGAEARLLTHSWPGNVRELENVIAATVIRAGDEKMSMPVRS